MARRGVTRAFALATGLLAPKPTEPKGRRLPSLEGVGLDRITESDLQRQIVTTLRRAGMTVTAVPNQRVMRHLSDATAHKMLSVLVAEGMVAGASDLLVQWDAAKGKPGNRGLAWIELKRPVNPAPVSADQDLFIANQRALGVVAGVAQSYEQAEALLVEAGAPLRFRTVWPAPVTDTHKEEAPGTAIPSASNT